MPVSELIFTKTPSKRGRSHCEVLRFDRLTRKLDAALTSPAANAEANNLLFKHCILILYFVFRSVIGWGISSADNG